MTALGMPLTESLAVTITLDLVRRLLAVHCPRWASLPITEVQSAGTQNAIFRLGDDLCARLPRRQRPAIRLEKEVRWNPIIGERQDILEIPIPVAMIGATRDFCLPWAIYRWIEGEPFTLARSVDSQEAGERLGAFLIALRRISAVGAPLSQLNGSVVDRDADMRRALGVVEHIVDEERATALWDRALGAPMWNGSLLWTHGDLLPNNLLLRHGRLTAVIDFGYAGIADAAIDLLPAWTTFDTQGRAAFRRVLDVDDATWLRGRAFALHLAITMAAEHLQRGGAMLDLAVRTAEAVLVDR